MAGLIKKCLKLSILAVVIPVVAFAAQQQNPRAASVRSTARSVETDSNSSIRRSATSVIARNAAVNSRKKHTVVTARPGTVKTESVRSARPVITSNTTKSRAAAPKSALVRSGNVINTTSNKKTGTNTSRAASSRATAVFNDITKIGGGYSNCRDAYATCMDQLCANANDTYRRCFCSDRFQDFRDTADRLDDALRMLAEFQDNNLNAVDKTAAEVNAMYSATAGEEAIKKDTSASQKLLDSISDVLSGKSSAQTTKQNLNSLGVLDLSGFGSMDDDIFGGGSSSIFDTSSTPNVADLEGKALYDDASKQCSEITRESCGSDAMFNLARSAYSIMITQDCNAYEKNISAKKASVEETVRTAEKYLREARLEEYRAHNGQDVNECLSKVEEAIKNPMACGPNYEKCLDYTGMYINASTGEPIYSQALFGLNKLIVLDGSADVLSANSSFDKWLEDRKMFATTALDTCRDKADIVWTEFKRAAMIHIAQAQDEKIQEIKDSCVVTIKECYDEQTGALQDIDTTKMQSTDAIAAVTARGMCYDRVQACAALYGDPDGCKYDDATKKLTVNDKCKTGTPDKPCKCGLQSLLTFVDTVDAVKVAEGCEAALTKYAKELCPESDVKDPETGKIIENVEYGSCFTTSTGKKKSRSELRAAMDLRRKTFCAEDLVNNDESNTLQEQNAFNVNIMEQIIKDIYASIQLTFTSGCTDDKEINGIWVSADDIAKPNPAMLAQKFYKKYYGTEITDVKQVEEFNIPEMGWCVVGDTKSQCEQLGTAYAEYKTDQGCVLSDDWYKHVCEDILGGTLTGSGINVKCKTNFGEADKTKIDPEDPETPKGEQGGDNNDISGQLNQPTNKQLCDSIKGSYHKTGNIEFCTCRQLFVGAADGKGFNSLIASKRGFSWSSNGICDAAGMSSAKPTSLSDCLQRIKQNNSTIYGDTVTCKSK